MNVLPPPLLCSSSLMIGESLSSLKIRLEKCNDYDSSDMLSSICRQWLKIHGIKDNLNRPSKIETFEILAALTRIDPAELFAATAHRFAPTLVPSDATHNWLSFSPNTKSPLLDKGILSKRFRSGYAAQFCPDCLREAAYHRLAWEPIAVAVCLQHKCLLVNYCPKCHDLVTIRNIVERRCRNCGAELTETKSIFVEDDLFGLFSQHIIQAWLNLISLPPNPWLCSLPEQPPAVLYRLVDGLRLSIKNLGIGWEYMHKIVGSMKSIQSSRIPAAPGPMPDVAYRLYTTAFKGIVNWPTGFYEFLSAYYSESGAGMKKKSVYEMRIITGRLKGYWQHQTFDFVRDAFNQYFTDNDIAQFISKKSKVKDNSDYIGIKEAAKLLNTRSKIIKQLLRTGQLIDYSPVTNIKYHCIQRIEVLELSSRWIAPLLLEDVSQLTGISTRIIVDIVEAELLVAQKILGVDDDIFWVFSEQDVNIFITKIVNRVMDSSISSGATADLKSGSLIISPIGVNAAGLIKFLLDGKIRGYLPPHYSDLGKLRFMISDLKACVETAKTERGWIRQSEIAKRIGTSVHAIQSWIRVGLLSPTTVVGNTQYFDRSMVEQFVVDHILSQEAARLLNMTQHTLGGLARSGRLKAVSSPMTDKSSPYLFRREDILGAREEYDTTV